MSGRALAVKRPLKQHQKLNPMDQSAVMSKNDMSNILRQDNDERCQHYWYVRFQAVGVNKTFSDGVHGGKRKALAMAVEYRDKMRKKYPRSYTGDNLRRKSYKYSEGVYLREKGEGLDWIAWWSKKVKGKMKVYQKSFSIFKYGNTKAKKMALECRKKNLK